MKKYMINVNGNAYEVEVEEIKDGVAQTMTPAPKAAPIPKATPAPKAAPAPKATPAPKAAPGAGGSVSSPMPGNIFKVNVKPGDTVNKGDVLIILEAMKMENEIFAPQDGVIASVPVNEGMSVNSGDVLVTFQ